MDCNRILHIAADAGRIILENGGETYRVEETISRICTALGVVESDSLVIPTGITISVTDENGVTFSMVKRITKRTVNLKKIDKVNDLSRNITINSLSMDILENKLADIDSIPTYRKSTLILAASFGACFFTLILGGDYRDAFIAFIIGSLIKYTSLKLTKISLNDFLSNILGGAIATLIALLAVKFNIANHEDKIIIGSIMLLVPGLAITNAIRDTIEGDLVSGVSRAIEAFFIAVAIALGTGLVYKIWFL